jgi:flavin reductase (DIM6/NTAB) family NADH-FMN oxidoreductase RutF
MSSSVSGSVSSPSVESVLEELWSPVAALTAAQGGRSNGLITSTAVTASLLPESPRVSVVLGRGGVTHELALAAGAFALHLLPAEPLDRSLELFRTLGFESGAGADKLAEIPWHPGSTGAPILDEALAFVEARIASAVDGGDVTVVLADVVAGGRLREGRHLTIDDVRARLTSDDWAAWDARREEEVRRARRLRPRRT